MTAVDVDALAELREAATGRLWSALENVGVLDHSNDPERDRADLDADIAASLEPLLAEVRRGRALREAVRNLADSYGRWPFRVDPLSVTRRLDAVLAALDPS